MMHVEIDHGDALGAMRGAGVDGGDRHIVEQAEAHGPCRLGMVSRRAHSAKGVVGSAGHDLIDRVDHGSGGSERRLPAPRRHDRVGVEPDQVVLRRGGADRLDIAGRVHPLDHGEIGERRLLSLQAAERTASQRLVDSAQAVRPLGVALPGIVQEAGWMGEEERRHRQIAWMGACSLTRQC